MSGRLSRRIGRLEARAARQREIDQADDPPPGFQCWGDPEARGLIAHAALRAALMALEGRASGEPPMPPNRAREIAWRAAREMDDLIARGGIEAAHNVMGNDFEK